jgi:hypothetical protein
MIEQVTPFQDCVLISSYHATLFSRTPPQQPRPKYTIVIRVIRYYKFKIPIRHIPSHHGTAFISQWICCRVPSCRNGLPRHDKNLLQLVLLILFKGNSEILGGDSCELLYLSGAFFSSIDSSFPLVLSCRTLNHRPGDAMRT